MRCKHSLIFYLTIVLVLSVISCASSTRLEENCKKIEAAFRLSNDGATYFLNGEEYIEYSLYRESEAKVGPLTELGLHDFVYSSSAAFTLNDGSVVFLKGLQYFIYSSFDGCLYHQSEGIYFGGLPNPPNAALNWAGDIFVFEGCNVWKLSNDTATFHQEGTLADRGLPCDLDAAVEWESEKAIFLKGSQFWIFDGEMRGPYHTDNLNICSWYICGEATWMTERNRGSLCCNGDPRLCDLRLNQVTLPGLHNAGSGFDGGFGFLNCWVRNHARTILEQMQIGIRHLDIDTSFSHCGVLGSNHASFCGGSICRILKQVRTFLSQNPHEIVTLNFNHEMVDPEIVIPALTRQLKNQLRPMLNNRYRMSGEQQWPRLRQAVRSNKRVFVFYATPFINTQPFESRFYRRNKWIHTERWLASTWRPFSVTDNNCSEIVRLTQARCRVKQYHKLIEVSIVPQTAGSCISTLAGLCKHHLHDALRACQPYRFSHNASPNVLLVDYPEVNAQVTTSVFHAVYHQNVRNILQHRPGSCRVKIDAAVRKPHSTDQVLFFVRSTIIIYSFTQNVQINEITIPGVSSVDAAYIQGDNIVLTKGCETLLLNGSSLEPLTHHWSDIAPCDSTYDGADVWNFTLHIFKGCHLKVQNQPPENLTVYGLPCDVDAAFTFGTKTFVFKENNFWVRTSEDTTFIPGGYSLDWTIDAVVC
ncbi:matrix metalloproteinase-14 [Plakobranchus ocellatus]|uniref:Matrix metalloproteinase-14 n=1 Tax=Plakobranchus ocellatus TaxID=259542 RepID=A0AAV3YS33_9GAST|nr:matrix metalloproteinase-14 [Plakobranchus ocellatus]